MKKFLLPVLVLTVLLASCTHTSPFTSEYYFQALGEDGEFVLTADVSQMKEGEFRTLLPEGNYIFEKAERVSASLVPEASEVYPLPMENFVLSAALEGNYSKSTINTGLALSSSFSKEKGNGTKWYTDGTYSLASPENGIILFTEGDYADFYQRTIQERKTLIDDETAAKMAEAEFAVYASNPETLMDIGFELPKTVLQEVVSTALMFTETDGRMVMDGRLEMENAGTARALTTLLKLQVIMDARKSGQTFDPKTMGNYFVNQDAVVTINSYILNDEMKAKARTLASSTLGGLL